MDCLDWENEIARREAGLLDDAQLKALAAHLAGCEPCRSADLRISQMSRALSAMPVTPAPKDFLDASWRKIERNTPLHRTGTFRRMRSKLVGPNAPPLWVPLSVALLVVIVLAIFSNDGGGGRPRAEAPIKILSQSGSVKVERLPGSRAIIETQGGAIDLEHAGRARWTLSGSGTRLAIGLGSTPIALEAGAADVKVAAGPAAYVATAPGARISSTAAAYRLVVTPVAKLSVNEGKVQVAGPDWSRDVATGQALEWTDAGPK